MWKDRVDTPDSPGREDRGDQRLAAGGQDLGSSGSAAERVDPRLHSDNTTEVTSVETARRQHRLCIKSTRSADSPVEDTTKGGKGSQGDGHEPATRPGRSAVSRGSHDERCKWVVEGMRRRVKWV
jgi:hypothetical protein